MLHHQSDDLKFKTNGHIDQSAYGICTQYARREGHLALTRSINHLDWR